MNDLKIASSKLPQTKIRPRNQGDLPQEAQNTQDEDVKEGGFSNPL